MAADSKGDTNGPFIFPASWHVHLRPADSSSWFVTLLRPAWREIMCQGALGTQQCDEKFSSSSLFLPYQSYVMINHFKLWMRNQSTQGKPDTYICGQLIPAPNLSHCWGLPDERSCACLGGSAVWPQEKFPLSSLFLPHQSYIMTCQLSKVLGENLTRTFAPSWFQLLICHTAEAWQEMCLPWDPAVTARGIFLILTYSSISELIITISQLTKVPGENHWHCQLSHMP